MLISDSLVIDFHSKTTATCATIPQGAFLSSGSASVRRAVTKWRYWVAERITSIKGRKAKELGRLAERIAHISKRSISPLNAEDAGCVDVAE